MQTHFKSFWAPEKLMENRSFDKFLFEHSFDESPHEEVLIEKEDLILPEEVEEIEEVEKEPELPPPPLFTEEEKQQAYEAGILKGREAGYQQASEEMGVSLDAQIKIHVEKIELFLEEGLVATQDRKRELTYQVILLSKQVFHKLFPVLESKWGEDQVEKLVASVLQDEKPEMLQVRLNPRSKEALQVHLEKWSKISRISLEADETMGISDCNIAWDQSGLERRLEKIVQEIENLFNSFESILKESEQTSLKK
ncbi:MAG: hypothetical protein ACRCYP_01035 [Alphaproteobacteria bacterium]